VAGRASGLKKLSGEVLAWLPVWRGADLHVAQLMPLPLPLTVSCFSKIQIGFTFLVPAHLGSPRKRAVKQVCVCNIVQRGPPEIAKELLSNQADKESKKPRQTRHSSRQ